MILKASNYKNWCHDNISPQAWARVILKNLTLVRDKGYTMSQLQEAEPDIDLEEELIEVFNATLFELYELSVDETLLVRY